LSSKVQDLLIYLYGQRHYIYGKRNHLHLCLQLEVCNVFQRTQAYCLNVSIIKQLSKILTAYD